MFAAKRSAASMRQLLRTQPPRRFGSHSAHAEPVNESFGVSSSPRESIRIRPTTPTPNRMRNHEINC